jgi:hypothetical protein
VIGKQPTFAECSLELWWDDAEGAWAPDPWELDGEQLPEVEKFIKQFWQWRLIQTDPDEAMAREAYATHAARNLVGLYPNSRVNADAFAIAAGEDLGQFSADIVKLVAQTARRSSKTLPSLAHLLELAMAEEQRRWAQLNALEQAMREYKKAIDRGQDQARDVINRGGLAGRLTPERLGTFHRRLAGFSMGIQPPQPVRFPPCYVTRMNRLFCLILQGHKGAANWLAEAICESERLCALVVAASEGERGENALEKYLSQCRQTLNALLEGEAAARPGQ